MFLCAIHVQASDGAASTRFQAELEQLAQRSGLNVGFAIQDLSSGEKFVVNENTVFHKRYSKVHKFLTLLGHG